MERDVIHLIFSAVAETRSHNYKLQRS